MPEPINESWLPVIQDLLHDLISGNFEAMRKKGSLVRGDESVIKDRIEHWGIPQMPDPECIRVPDDLWQLPIEAESSGESRYMLVYFLRYTSSPNNTPVEICVTATGDQIETIYLWDVF